MSNTAIVGFVLGWDSWDTWDLWVRRVDGPWPLTVNRELRTVNGEPFLTILK